MATDLTALGGVVRVLAEMKARKYTAEGSEGLDKITHEIVETLTFGDTADKIDQIFYERRVLAAGAEYVYDLCGVLKNPFGGLITFATVKLIVVHNRSDEQTPPTEGVLNVGSAAGTIFSYPFADPSDMVQLPWGAWWAWCTPGNQAVPADGVTDLLRVDEINAVQAEYDIIIAGTNT